VSDLSPAKISDQIYAFSKLARVDVPLSGRGTDARLAPTDRVRADERKRARKQRREQQP